MTWQSRLEKRPRYVRAIGMISVEIANLELFLAELFSRVLFVSDPIGEAIYLTPRASGARLDILESAAAAALAPHGRNMLHPENLRMARELKRVISIAKRSRGVLGRRHEIMHAGWALSKTGRQVGRVPMPPKRLTSGKYTGILVKLSDLTNLIHDTRVLITDVQDLIEKFRAHPPTLVDLRRPLPEKTPPQNPG